ncbi:lysine-sensitive aspartokinase 3 [Thalassotalea ponticola]|uniref:lysine-sensitive aspartokinase 3 n=1 Tax=Thalassotalea ponticola TaxID=1523392 RepID=UPI0025B5DD3D|nr:lysine-sensitive aspartokinase 3 [Thalassotalea ponticola]MDN3653123.1 lysine-sensitive aspartokinase 3 [Thalassotalea ponticola]
MLHIAKFGGTSVADYQAMLRCAEIVQRDPHTKVIVLSASAGVTNHLITLSQPGIDTALQQQVIGEIAAIAYNISKHLTNKQQIDQQLASLVEQLTSLVQLQTISPTALTGDAILAFGEQISSLLFTQVLNSLGVQAQWFDARRVVRTDSTFTKAVVDIDYVKHACETILLPLIDTQVIVTQGFIGADEHNNTTTLGRGGSDYSAALLAEGCGATSVNIWTDVIGIFTTDPRITAKARAIDEISFGEAAEMATFGAKVLHPATLVPAMRADIPVFVGSSREPLAGGTHIRREVQSKPSYRAIAIRKGQTLVTVKSEAMLHASGFLAQVFAILAKHKLSVDLITTSEISVALTFDNPQGEQQAVINRQVINELEQFCEVTVEHGLSLVAIVGNNLHTSDHLAGGVFNHLDGISIRMICHGASANNLCFLVAEQQTDHVVERLHAQLFA